MVPLIYLFFYTQFEINETIQMLTIFSELDWQESENNARYAFPIPTKNPDGRRQCLNLWPYGRLTPIKAG